MPALALALAEMADHGPELMDRTVTNARALGRALAREGIPVIEADDRPTDSHTILARVAEFGTGERFAIALEAAGIITTHALLPDAFGREGLRLGSQEVTRLGAIETTMAEAAALIADVVLARRPSPAVESDVKSLVGGLPRL
jgi:glycine/serine hydroxymethyltransferase